jgi:uncharacterized lipoprotein YajG
MVLKRVNGCMGVTLLLLVVTGCFACAKKSYIDVSYRLPSTADTLAGRTVFVETHDLRNDTEIFNKRTNENFQHFTGLFSLTLVTPDDQSKVVGAYPLPKLFEAALTQRLQKLGVRVSAAPSPSVPVFQININQFHINLVGQKWMADISYEVSLTQDTQLVALEVVSGSAERLKVMGSGGAEKVIGEIFTDMINRLDIERLFQQAKL